MKFLTEDEALCKVAAYCSSAEHCKAEVTEKLVKWGVSSEAVDRILNHLEAEKYIDEERYCKAFVNDKFRFSKWGKVKIAQALYLKKIPADMGWKYLNELNQEEYLFVLSNLIAAKRKSVRADNDYQLNGKLVRFALSRGFEMKDINQCLRLSDDEAYIG